MARRLRGIEARSGARGAHADWPRPERLALGQLITGRRRLDEVKGVCQSMLDGRTGSGVLVI